MTARILIVDDEKSIRRTLGEFLRVEGYEVMEAEDAEAALQRLNEAEFDVVVTDIILPRVSGVELLRRIHTVAPRVQVIMMTGEPTVETASESLRAGAADYLFKPITKASILRVVANATRLKLLEEARRRLEAENLVYQEGLERLVEERTGQLRASEARYRSLVDTARDTILTVSPEGQLTSASAQFGTLTGWKRDECVGRGFDGLIHEADRPRAHAMLARALQGEQLPTFELRVLDRAGGWVPVELNVTTLCAEGRVLELLAVARDVRERHHVEQQLRDSEALYHSLVEHMPQHVFRKDLSGRFTFVNSAFCRSVGHSASQLLGRTDEDFFPAALAAKYRYDDGRVVETGEPFAGEEEYVASDGSLRWVEVIKLPLRDAQERIVGIQGISWNITDRKRAEMAVRDAQQLYHSLIEHLPQSIFRKDREGRFTYANDHFCALLGVSREALLGQTVSDFVPAEVAGRYAADDARVLATGQVFETIEERLSPGGAKVVLHVIKAPVRSAAGEVIGIQGIFTDITSQREMEAKFLRAQRLESVGSLASGIAHDLNNILTPIIMCAPLLALDESAEGRKELAETIESSAQRAVAIVKQLLSFGRGKEGQRATLQMRHLIRDMAKIARETFPRNIQVEEHAASDLWPIVADATQIHQIILNLCVNARDALPAGGRIILRAENVTLDEHFTSMHPEAVPGPFVRLQVEDTGTGIPETVQPHIFQTFFTTKAEGQGTGLGLTTVQGIVRGHKGFITFTTRPGQGTCFEVHLPAAPDRLAGAESAVAAGDIPRGQGELILVVDDEPAVRDSTRRNLERYGYAVVQAADGIDALARFSALQGTVRAVVTDVMMPLMDGVTLCRTLRTLSPHTPIVVSSGGLLGKASHEALQAFGELGIHHVLHKPHTADLLLSTLADILHPAASDHTDRNPA